MDKDADSLNLRILELLAYILETECEAGYPGHTNCIKAFEARNELMGVSNKNGHTFLLLINLLRSMGVRRDGNYPPGMKHFEESQYPVGLEVKLACLRVLNRIVGIDLKLESLPGTQGVQEGGC